MTEKIFMKLPPGSEGREIYGSDCKGKFSISFTDCIRNNLKD
jgi:hypothetical protein